MRLLWGLLAGAAACGQRQEDRQIHERIHDREERAEELDEKGGIHVGLPVCGAGLAQAAGRAHATSCVPAVV